MYKISVPVMNEYLKRNGRDETLRELKRMDAERVFLALDCYEQDPQKRKEAMEALSQNCRFFKAHGFEVGAWIWTFWVKGAHGFRCMRSLSGKDETEFACPTDERFVAFACDYIAGVARCGVDLIMFDDDFRYGIRSETPSCLCEGHIRAINRITGEESSREELANYILTGGKNKFRDAFLQVNGDSFRAFAHAVRAAVNSVDSTIRMGLCTCMSTWDLDGTDAYELSKILAGDNRLFTRLIGAPYWAVSKNFVKDVPSAVEMERMESAWTRNGEIEIMAEGDAYPRPRTNCPASYLEIFDTAIRASGCTDGILKYGIDYVSNARYETGYADTHQRNKQLYEDFSRVFGGKESCGVRVYESMKKIANMVNPTRVNQTVRIDWLMFPHAAFMLSYNSIPTTYEGEGVTGICFDENARDLPLEALKNGLILDIAAAEILASRGVDTGFSDIGALRDGPSEHYIEEDLHVGLFGSRVYDVRLKEDARVLSELSEQDHCVPISWCYENADGNRFLVLNVNTRTEGDNILKHYARGKQIVQWIPWLSGKSLPAYSYGNPNLYLQAKKDANGMAVGLWNFFADPITHPIVELDEEYASVEAINCTATLEGNRVILGELPAFGIAAFEVKKG